MQGSYDPVLVLLSVVTAVIASFVALDMASRVAWAKEHAGNAWLLLGTGALAMGSGIWSMHFVGMLAFSLPVPLAYEIRITGLSWLVAVLPRRWRCRRSAARCSAGADCSAPAP